MEDFRGEEKMFDDFILEMANVGPQIHKFGVNVKMHLLQPGDKQLSHGPRAKFFKNSIDDGFSISISSTSSKVKVVSGEDSKIVSEGEMNTLVEKVRKYRIPLLNFWRNSNMTVDELRDQMDAIDEGQAVEEFK